MNNVFMQISDMVCLFVAAGGGCFFVFCTNNQSL